MSAQDIVLRSVGSTATGTTSLTLAAPSGVQENDLLVMLLSHKGTGYATLPEGWTAAAQDLSSTVRGELAWKRATASEPASYAVTGLAECAVGAIVAYDGVVETGDPVDAVATQANAAGAKGSPALTTTAESCLLVTMAAVSGNTRCYQWYPVTTAIRPTPFAQFSTPGFVDAGTSSGTGCGVAAQHTVMAVPGDTQAFTWNAGGGAVNVGLTVAFAPEVVGTATSTRLYLTTASPSANHPGPARGTWDRDISGDRMHGLQGWCWSLSTEKAGGGTLYTGTAEIPEGTTSLDVLFGRWVTEPLQAQTISGTLSLLLAPTLSGGVGAWRLHVYITQGTTSTVRATLLDNSLDGSTWSGSAVYRAMAATALTSGSAQAGDCLVVEVGCRVTSGTPLSAGTASLTFCTTTAPGLPLPDATAGDAAAVSAGYLDLSHVVTLQTPPPAPTNISAATATALGTLPTTVTASTTSVAHPSRSVWYTLTAATTGMHFVNTFGGNYRTKIWVWETAGGGVVGTYQASGQMAQWMGASQSTAYWSATAGQAYLIRVDSYAASSSTPTGTAPFSGGFLTMTVTAARTPQAGDLFVNCAHIVCYRNGAPILCQSDFYSYTPTASAIDATGRPIVNQNDLSTHTAPRLLVTLFGSGGYIEILDLATLNIGEAEIDYIGSPLSGGDNAGSLVMDRAGTVYVGYYGDHYDVIAGLSTASSCAVRSIDATHGDNQAGAPFTATAYPVAQDLGGSDFIDLSSNQTTLWYTSAGRAILRYDIVSGQQAHFVTLAAESGPRPGLRGLRLLPPGDGSTGLLVCDGINVKRLNASGAVVQTYTPSTGVSDLDKVEIAANGLSFWCSDQLSASLYHFNLETGAEIETIQTGLPAGQLCGFSLFDGYRSGQSDDTPEDGSVTGTAAIVLPCLAVAAAGQVSRASGSVSTKRWIRRLHQSPHLSAEAVWLFLTRFELYLETGIGTSAGEGVDPQVMLQWSKDGGHTWSSEVWVSAGRAGEYARRAVWRRLGRARDVVFRIVVDAPVDWTLLGASIDAQRGIA